MNLFPYNPTSTVKNKIVVFLTSYYVITRTVNINNFDLLALMKSVVVYSHENK